MKKLILLFGISILIASCKKEDISEPESHIVTLYAYSEQGLSVINYMNADGDYFRTSIFKQSETIETTQNENSYKYSITLTSQGSDSLFLMATYNGKTTSTGYRSNGFGETQISIKLNNLE